jgi:uncharacterized protein (DUF58 family)
VVVSGRFVALMALGVAWAPVGWAAMLGWGSLVALVAALDLALAAPITGLCFSRTPSDPVRLGVGGQSTVRVLNAGSRRWRGVVRDAWVPSAGSSPRHQACVLGSGEQRLLITELRPTRRGERPAAQLTVRSFGPAGLAGRQRRLSLPGSIRVLPAFNSRKFLPEKLARLRQLDGAVLIRQRGRGSEFDSLREYVPGDDVRAIDWRASARSSEVMVRTWRPERDRHLVLAIDTGRTSAARIGDEPRLDAALDAALLLAAVAGRAGDRVALVAADTTVRSRLGLTSGAEILPRLVTALAPLEPALVETDPQLLSSQVLRLTSKRSLVVLFSALDAASSEGGLLPAVTQLAGRHQVVVASVADPRLAELSCGRADSVAVYTAAAAEADAAQRRALSERLALLGARVIDAPPATFASVVTDAYLDLKAAGRL